MNNFAHLKPESPFYSVFERGVAPIRNILLPRVGEMGNLGMVEFYDLDVEKCSDAQVHTICEMVARQCDGSAADCEAFMREQKFIPLRALHVCFVSTDSRAFL